LSNVFNNYKSTTNVHQITHYWASRSMFGISQGKYAVTAS